MHPIPGGLLQCLKDTHPLGLSRRAPADRPEVGILRVTPQFDQIRTGQFRMGRGHHGSLDIMLELTDIPGPRRSRQGTHGLFIHLTQILPMPLAGVGNKFYDQQGNVHPPVTERRQMNGQHG